jgi:hypothetical protein
MVMKGVAPIVFLLVVYERLKRKLPARVGSDGELV